MSKIVSVVNVMILNSFKITNVFPGLDNSKEYYFLYDNKHKWSIRKDAEDKEMFLHYYPGNQTVKELSQIIDFNNFDEMVTYSTVELYSREAYSSLQELYSTVQEKLFGMDEVFDDILNTGEDVPF